LTLTTSPIWPSLPIRSSRMTSMTFTPVLMVGVLMVGLSD
jgi:hypothetical protein